MFKYTLYTEWKANLNELTSAHFDAFTIMGAKGSWKGQPESSALIVIMSKTQIPEAIAKLAASIKYANQQEAIAIETQYVDVQLV